jgi:hypothetical protein
MLAMPEEPAEHMPPCLTQQQLIAGVQEHLMQISNCRGPYLKRWRTGTKIAAELDKQVDLEFGKKERAMGALQQHRKEHGCG